MKIKESQLRQIIRESLMEYSPVYDNDSLYNAYEKMKEALGAEKLLDELVQAMNDQELRENLEWIDRQYDLGAFEEESYDEEEGLYEGKINPDDYTDDDEYVPGKKYTDKTMKRDGKKVPKMRN